MLKRLGAVLLAVGFFLPYSPDVRVILSVWHNAAEVLFQGVPLLIGVAYVLHTLVPPLARFHQRHGPALHGVFRMVYFVLVGAYVATAVAGRADWPAVGPVLVALVVTGTLLYWGQGRGTKADRLPLLLVVCGGVPTIAYFIETLRAGALAYGGWVFTAGYLVAVAGEVQGLRAAPRIAHGG
ncbi:MAG TPA: hypothetical protein VEK85_01445 [Gemmatimonadales bacterium]|nr:hypothetical protein [Gemmatimonadales bacterium]